MTHACTQEFVKICMDTVIKWWSKAIKGWVEATREKMGCQQRIDIVCGETTNGENRGETTEGETTRAEMVWVETSCYP